MNFCRKPGCSLEEFLVELRDKFPMVLSEKFPVELLEHFSVELLAELPVCRTLRSIPEGIPDGTANGIPS